MGNGARVRACLLAVFIGASLQGHASGSPATTPPSFDETACDLPGLSPELRPRLQCGTVSVLRDHDNAAAGLFKLAIVIVRTPAQERQPDPVLFLQGGPGSPLTSRAARIAQNESAILAPDRDLILIDQRGAGRSEPALCPDLPALQLGLVAQNLEPEAFAQAWRDSYKDCRRELTGQGLDPAWFGTNVTAEDLEVVRHALGISRWNVYGRSYGTTVAMTLMARYPNTLRAVVLDSVYPPDPLPRTYSETVDDALNALFEACHSDATCAAAHPDLRATFHEAMAGLGKTPLPVTLRPGRGPKTMILGPVALAAIVEQSLFYRPLLAMLPHMIQAAHDCDAAALQPLIEHLVENFLDESPGDAAAVECRDRPGPHSTAGAKMPGGPVGIPDLHDEICGDWAVPGNQPIVAASPGVPSLLLAGGIDPRTPPIFAKQAAQAIGSNAQVVEFPNLSHDIEEFSPCGAGLITRFIERPDDRLDAACAAAAPTVKFR
jgi:pimeloyl-ACP methyl ester carboxylesterase